MAAVLIRPNASEKSRLRLFVVQALVLSLFLTLFARLWYMQVATGDGYRAAAAEQSVRDVVVQPARGLIVDDHGSPARGQPQQLGGQPRPDPARQAARRRPRRRRCAGCPGWCNVPVPKIEERILLCGQPGSKSGTCWNGSPYQPVPVARDVTQKIAVKVLEQSEDYPGVLAQQESVRAYPSPYGVNGAHLLGYLSPITEGELDEAEKEDDRSVNGASVVGRAGVEKAYDNWLRGQPGYKKVAVDSMGRVLGDSGEVESTPGDTLVTSIDSKVQAHVEKQLQRTIQTARATIDTVTGRKYAADSGAAVVLDARNGRVVAMASQPTYDPKVWSGGITAKQLKRLYSGAAGTPLLSRATQGQFAPGSTWKPMMTAGRPRERLQHGHDPGLLLRLPGRQPDVQELRVRAPMAPSAS